MPDAARSGSPRTDSLPVSGLEPATAPAPSPTDGASATAGGAAGHRARPRLWPLALGTFAIGFGSNIMSGLLPSMSADLGVTVPEIGRLVSVYGFTYAVTTPLVALAGNRLPRRLLMLTALALFTLACAATAFAQDYDTIALLRGLAAFAAGGFTPTATVLASRLAAPGERGRALATVFGGLTTATVVAAPVGNLLGPVLGYQGVYALTALLGIVAFTAVLVLVPRPSRQMLAAAIVDRPGRGWPSPIVLVVLLVSMLETAAALMVQTYASPLLTAMSGVDGIGLSLLLLCYGAAGVLGNIVGGRMADRWGASRTLWLSFAVCGIALLLLPVASRSVFGAGVVFAVWGFAAWAANSPLQGILLGLAGRHGQLVVALNSSVIALGTGLGALAGGFIITGGGILVIAYWGAAVMAVVVALVLIISARGRVAAF